jgi:ubiquinone/menaquinone biosynthesis C-methylase UbiE
MNFIKEEIATQDRVSDFYENERYVKPYSLAYHKAWSKRMLSALTLKSPILDNGCGTGFLAEFLKEYEVIGLDISPGMVALAQQKYAKVLQGDSQKLPFADSSFQTILNRGVLHHMSDPQQAINEISRVLAKAGQVVFSETLSNWPAALPRKLIRGTKHFSHLHKSFTEKELRGMIEPQLKIEKVYYWGWLTHIFLGFPDVVDVYKFVPFKNIFTPLLLKFDELIAKVPFLNKQLCWIIIISAKKI